MIPSIGPMEIAIVVILALVVFGPRRLPELGSSIGRSIRGFRAEIKGGDEDGRDAALAAPETEAESAAPMR